MKFSVITPTCRRADKLARAVGSVMDQAYTDWELIIVNDSPNDASYELFEKSISDPRIIYLKNEQNMGVNFSRNRALDMVSKSSDWVIFLDDDDWFAEDTLENFVNLITKNPNENWFVTNRAFTNDKPITNFPKSDAEYFYAWDYLISKRCKGDATHCIKTSLVNGIRFSKQIKQAEEWLFFYQLGLKEQMFYSNHNSTLTDGYDNAYGLNFRSRTRDKQLKNFFNLALDGYNLHLLRHPTFLVYLFIRFIRILVKP